MTDDERLWSEIRRYLAFPVRRPGWAGWAIWTALGARAAVMVPFVIFCGFLIQGGKVAAGLAAIVAGLGGILLALVAGYIFLVAFLSLAGWAVRP